MSTDGSIRTLLMSADYTNGASGFHRLVFKVDQGRGRTLSNVTVMISVDAYRKLAMQLNRARFPRLDRDRLLMSWARWEIASRLDDHGAIGATITVTASDLDELGAYAHGFGRTLLAS